MEDPYPSIGDYGLLGDCHSAALVSRRGSIDWCCLPRFDSGSAFARLLDHERGGHCSLTPTLSGDWQYERAYVEDTLVLATTVEGPGGHARITDCFLAGEERSTPHLIVEAVDAIGRVRPAIVVCDVAMPVMDGFAVVARIAERHLTVLLENICRFVRGQPLSNVVDKTRWF